MVEHTGAKIGFYPDSRAEKTYTPKESAKYHSEYDIKHRTAYLLYEEIHIKGHRYPVDLNLTEFDTVYNHAVKLGNLKLEHIDEKQSQNTKDKHMSVFEIVFVNVLAENQIRRLLKKQVTLHHITLHHFLQ